jgi:uncharacterized membrane protein
MRRCTTAVAATKTRPSNRRAIEQSNERTARLLAVLAVFPVLVALPALTLAQNQPQNQNTQQTQAIQQQVQKNLQQAGFTDIHIMPSSFLVRAKDKDGNPS